jgi:hypothetical protein
MRWRVSLDGNSGKRLKMQAFARLGHFQSHHFVVEFQRGVNHGILDKQPRRRGEFREQATMLQTHGV